MRLAKTEGENRDGVRDPMASIMRIFGLASCLVWFGVSGFIESSPVANLSDLYTFVALAIVLFSAACLPRIVARVLGIKACPLICGAAAGVATILPIFFPEAEFTVVIASLLAGIGLSAILLSWGMVFASIDVSLLIKDLLLAQLLMSLFRLACDLMPVTAGNTLRACFVFLSGCCLVFLIGKGAFKKSVEVDIDKRSSSPISQLIKFVVAINLWALAINQLYSIYRFCSPLDFTSLSPAAIVIEMVFVTCLYFLFRAKKIRESHFYIAVAGATLVAFLLLPIFGLESPLPFLVLFVGFSALSLLTWVLSARVSSMFAIHPVTVFGCSLGSFLGIQIAIARLSAPSLFAPLADLPVGLSILCLAGVLSVLLAYYLVFKKSNLLGSLDKEPPSADPQPGHGDMFDNWDAVSGRYGLTRRESEVVLLFAKGRSYARIQEMLFISRGTVNYHMNNAYRKLGISSRQELLDLI
ncbi:MAG: LuxR C-terminal-related transcriptional regulator, partial [Raoultibacter sp.]